MQTEASLRVRADAATIFRLVADVEAWPRLLPHYRRVTVLQQDGPEHRIVEMRARRDVIPVGWTAEQRVFPSEPRITFTHVGGITRGMRVAWTFSPDADGTLVRVWHWFTPRWPLVPDWLVHVVVGRFFVDAIASRTLRCLAREASR